MQVHVVTHRNLASYKDEFDQFLVERHKIYAEELRWVPLAADRREHDPFDTERAVYFLGIEGSKVLAGSRLVPTDGPHMLSEVFPHLCTRNGGLISRSDVYEWTRGFVARGAREANSRIIYHFCAAVMEWALGEGLSQIGGIQRTDWLALWKRMGWKVYLHGEPTMFGQEPWLPAYFDVSEEALANAKRRAGLDGSQVLTGPGLQSEGFDRVPLS